MCSNKISPRRKKSTLLCHKNMSELCRPNSKKGEKPTVLQKDKPANVTTVLFEEDSTDGLLLAFVTENAMLQYNSIQVFGMKRIADGEELASCLKAVCNLEVDDTGRRMSKRADRRSMLIAAPSASHLIGDSSAKLFTVQFLGTANVSTEAWWKRVEMVARDAQFAALASPLAQASQTNRHKSVVEVYTEPFRNPERQVHNHFASEVVLSVSADSVSIVDCNTQELIVSTMTQSIFMVKKLPLPDDVLEIIEPGWAGAVGENDAPMDESKAGILLTDAQRKMVMEKVREGALTVDEAIAVVTKTEREIRRAERGQILCITFVDHELGLTHIITLLSKGGRPLETILEALARARKNAKLKLSDPFRELNHGQEVVLKNLAPGDVDLIQKAEIDRNMLTAVEHVGNGEFGEVYLANHVVGTREDGGEAIEVEEPRAVKTLKPKLPEHCAATFTAEAVVHLEFSHENIVKCLGVCMKQLPYLVVLEYCMYGDLKKVLTACKDSEVTLRGTELISYGRQIADALAYLTSIKIVHMDLATRNVLVAKGGILKVADFGLAKRYDKVGDKYTDGWKLNGKVRLPFLWIPPEALPEKQWNRAVLAYEPVFNEQTDMWSYGVLLWEMLTYGEAPYQFHDAKGLLPTLKRVFEGHRLKAPDSAPAMLSDLMEECFCANGERPKFADVESRLRKAVDGSSEKVRDIGHVLNAPKEEEIAQLSKEVSLQRQASVAVLRKQRSKATNIDGSAIPEAVAEGTEEGVSEAVDGGLGAVAEDGAAAASADGGAVKPRRASTHDEDEPDRGSIVEDDGMPVQDGEPGTPVRRVSRRPSQLMFNMDEWVLSEAGQLVRSPHPSRKPSEGPDGDAPVTPLVLVEDDDESESVSSPDVLKSFSVAQARRRLSTDGSGTVDADSSDDESTTSSMTSSPLAQQTEFFAETPVLTVSEGGVASAGAPAAATAMHSPMDAPAADALNPFGNDSDEESDEEIDIDAVLDAVKP
mmetsp:Transcript_32796/g.85830  ORF Transcript_32796/g.85830 Transcript_32796/m.85830 type:complete len:988 (-) Transcript_32796:1157-4120(-)